MTKTAKTKLLATHHTGKIKHYHHTSYGSLVAVFVLAFMPIFVVSRTVASAATDPVNDLYGTYAVVAGPIPTVGPTISNLTNGRTFVTTDPVDVKGSCPNGTLVKVYKNEVLAGATLCQGGSYQLPIDLFIGNNSLIARAYNANDAVSPDSTPVSVQLNLPGSSLDSGSQLNIKGAPAEQFYATSEVTHRGFAAGEPVNSSITLAGGQAPYAVSISWGDGKTDLMSRGVAGQFDISHAYARPASNGSYTIILKSTDQAGATTYLQIVAIVSGSHVAPGVVGSVKGGYNKSTPIRLALQGMAVIAVVILSFWLGEKREAKIVKRLAQRTM